MFPITRNTQREVEMQSRKENSFGAQFGGLDIKRASWRWPQTRFYVLLAVHCENKTNGQKAGCFHMDDLITKIVEGNDALKGEKTNLKKWVLCLCTVYKLSETSHYIPVDNTKQGVNISSHGVT